MNIGLINPPYIPGFSRQQRSPAVIKSGTLYYPYWLSFTAGVLEEARFNVQMVDSIADDLDFDQTLSKILRNETDMVVVESSTPSITNDLAFCRKIKEYNKETFVTLVGTHPSIMFEQILKKNLAVDVVAIGEYEYTIRDLAQCLSVGSNWGSIKGIAYLYNGRVIKTEKRPFISDLDQLPFVSRIYKKHLDINKYFFSLARHPMIMLITGRGCPNFCFFCVYPQTIHGQVYRYRSPVNVVDELEYIKAELPQVKEVVFEDDTFTANEERVREICRLILKRRIKVDWFANVRVNTNFETLKAMKTAGFRRCAVGFESGNQNILDAMGKGITLENSLEFKKYCDKLGILVHGCFMVGFPGETMETMKQTFEFAKRLNCDSAQFYPVFIYPGTKAYKWADKHHYFRTKNYSNWLTEEGYHNCVYDLPNLTAEQMSAFCERAYRKYYLSGNYLAFKLKQSLLKPKEARRNFRAGYNFFKFLFQH